LAWIAKAGRDVKLEEEALEGRLLLEEAAQWEEELVPEAKA
jgi:hypothetical protein